MTTHRDVRPELSPRFVAAVAAVGLAVAVIAQCRSEPMNPKHSLTDILDRLNGCVSVKAAAIAEIERLRGALKKSSQMLLSLSQNAPHVQNHVREEAFVMMDEIRATLTEDIDP